MCFVHAVACSNYKKTHIKMIGVLFHEKSGLEKKLWFPENSEFFEIHNFRQNAPKLVLPRRKFPGILSPTKPKKCKNIRVSLNSWASIQNFPGKFSRHSKNLEFSWISENPEISGKGWPRQKRSQIFNFQRVFH